MSAKHTPGPWIVLPEEADRTYIRIRGTRLGDRYKIANVMTLAYPGSEIVQEREAAVTRANATLIAAAPELLEALQAFMALDKSFSTICDAHLEEEAAKSPMGRAVKLARAAIAKAAGSAQ